MAKHLLPSQVLGKEGPLILKLLHIENDPLLNGSIYNSKPSQSVVTALYIYLESTFQVGKQTKRQKVAWSKGTMGLAQGEEKQEVSRFSQRQGLCLSGLSGMKKSSCGQNSLFLPVWGSSGSRRKAIEKERKVTTSAAQEAL